MTIPLGEQDIALRFARQNVALKQLLAESKEVIERQRDEIERLSSPPNSTATYLRPYGDYAMVYAGGREMRVSIATEDTLVPGDQVLVNDALAIIAIMEGDRYGDTATFDHLLEDGRAFVYNSLEDGTVLFLAGWLEDTEFKPGDTLLIDARAGFVLGVVDGMDEAQELVLEEVPDITYEDIGGLASQIEEIHDSIELPYLHQELFREYRRRAPKGILLYGPPGCGKTLVAKAVANSLAAKAGKDKAYFLNIKGPELLNKWVGESERKIREIFAMAREKASDGYPVIIFFDEMESMFRQRGGGISSDVEGTIVPTLLVEMDGVDELRNVIVIGASNRQDLIDPAILRPGRLDVKIQVGRPDAAASRDILSKYLTPDLPYREGIPAAELTADVIDFMFRGDKTTEFLEVTYVNGVQEMLHFSDFTSGAMIASIVDRAKTLAIKDDIAGKGKGISLEHLLGAVTAEFRESEDLPNTTNPDDWAKISGRKGERIANVRPVLRDVEAVDIATIINTGQYL